MSIVWHAVVVAVRVTVIITVCNFSFISGPWCVLFITILICIPFKCCVAHYWYDNVHHHYIIAVSLTMIVAACSSVTVTVELTCDSISETVTCDSIARQWYWQWQWQWQWQWYWQRYSGTVRVKMKMTETVIVTRVSASDSVQCGGGSVSGRCSATLRQWQ